MMTSKEIFIDARLTQHNRRCAGCQMEGGLQKNDNSINMDLL